MKIQLKKIITTDCNSYPPSNYIYLLIHVNGEHLCYLPSYAKGYMQKIERRNEKLRRISRYDMSRVEVALSDYHTFLKENNIRIHEASPIVKNKKEHPLKSRIKGLNDEMMCVFSNIREKYELGHKNGVSYSCIASYCQGKLKLDEEFDSLLESYRDISIKASNSDILLFDMDGAEMEDGYWWGKT